MPDLSPTKDILDAYKKKDIDWCTYEIKFKKLISERQIEDLLEAKETDNSCFLCSEVKADKCHRRLVVEYLQNKWGETIIHHL